MNKNCLNIKMFGTFEFENEGLIVNDNDNRSKKLWLLLAYLTYHRGTKISQERLLSILWGDSDLSTNPANALKTLFHRARVQLDSIGDDIGRGLFLCKKGEYFLNPDYPYELDLEQFELYCEQAKASTNIAQQKENYEKAFNLYNGDFLEKFSSESWIIPIATYYHNQYITVVDQLISIAEEEHNYKEVIEICTKANQIEKYEEHFYYHLMKNLIESEQYEVAIATYNDLSEMLQSSFGVKPSTTVKALYQKAMQSQQAYYLDVNEVQAQLADSSGNKPGALYCDYDFFCNIYSALSRGIERNGNAVHLAILTITDLNGKELSKRSLDTCITNLKELISTVLRKGDTFSMCSPSQFVIMLPNANLENSGMVTKRIEKAFMRQYPHTPAKLNFNIQPMLPPKMHNND